VNAAFSFIPEAKSSLIGTGDGISSHEPFLPNPHKLLKSWKFTVNNPPHI
jgi:hypothetical protein